MPDDYTECSKCHQTRWCIILPDEDGPICAKCLINIAYGQEDQTILRMKGFIRGHHTFPEHSGGRIDHQSYSGSLHSMEEDEEIPYKRNISNLLSHALPEGTVVEISIKVLDHDDRAINDPIVWYEPHHYEILSRLPEEKQKEIKKLIKEARS